MSPHSRRPGGSLGWAALLFAGIILSSTACQVPVFRYALERWESDIFELLVVVGPEGLTKEQEVVVQSLRDATASGAFSVNLRVEVSVVGADTPPPSGAAAGIASESSMTPRLELYFPPKLRSFLTADPIWQGPVTGTNAVRVLRSPMRTTLVKRLLAGESSVWIMVESGNLAEDEKAAKNLVHLIGQAGRELKIPEGIIGHNELASGRPLSPAEADNVLQSEIPLKIDFSLLRISRNDPEEAVLLGMLLNVEHDLGDFAGKPMVFPAFGRGRVLEPLIGAGMTEDNVMFAAGYLCGACSCQVKDENPGVDLLLAANWDEAIAGSEVVMDKVLPPLEGFPGLATVASRSGEGTETEVGAGTAKSEGSRLSPLKVLALVMVVVVLVIGLATIKLRRSAA